MTNVLDRDTSVSTSEGSIGVRERPEPKATPDERVLPPTPRSPYVRWLGWIMILAVVVVSGVLLFDRLNEDTLLADGSFEANEYARMLQLAPADGSFDVNEASRMLQLAPADGSFDVNEANRMLALEPAEASFEVNETNRMLNLMPEPDTSFETNEYNRMAQLAPSLTRDEVIRITTLVR